VFSFLWIIPQNPLFIMKSVIALLATATMASRGKYGTNPIRKVVTLLQAMAKKVEEEGKEEAKLFEKFVCYCDKNKGGLTASIAGAKAKIDQLETQVSEDTGIKMQVDEELKNHKQDLDEAQTALKSATQQRAQENAAYEKESRETTINIEALSKAIDVLKKVEQGQGSFLQAFLHTDAASTLQALIVHSSKLSVMDRESVAAFLSNSASAPGTTEIVNILAEMREEFLRDLKSIEKEESQRVRGFEELSAAKRKEIAAATSAIETKTQRSGALSMKMVEDKNDLKDTTKALEEDEKFKVNLKRDCATKDVEMHERMKTRSEELRAISETIKILNDDAALDMFKEKDDTGRSSSGSFLQNKIKSKNMEQDRAANIVNEIAKTYKSTPLDFIALALRGKKVDFTKVIRMIEDLVQLLGDEQIEDDNHKAYCEREFDTSDETKNAHIRRIDGLTHSTDEAGTVSKNLEREIQVLRHGIAALDDSVTEATVQRKAEHAEYLKNSSDNQQALQLIRYAKNRLNKFYNPKQYLPPASHEQNEEDRMFEAYKVKLKPTAAPVSDAGFLQLHAVVKAKKDAPPAPPGAFKPGYEKKKAGATGVISMMDMLSSDLQKDIQESERDEKDAQQDYEAVMADAQKKRAADSKLIMTKETAKSEADSVAQASNESLASSKKELYLTNEYIGNLHKSCDFLLENYDFRQAARAQEVTALNNAKAVLSGADFSLLEIRSSLRTRESPCIRHCRAMNRYPDSCDCGSSSDHDDFMPFDGRLRTKFIQIIQAGRKLYKDAHESAL